MSNKIGNECRTIEIEAYERKIKYKNEWDRIKNSGCGG